MVVLLSSGPCDLSGGNCGWSQIQIQRFKGAEDKWVAKSWEAPSIEGTEIHPLLTAFQSTL